MNKPENNDLLQQIEKLNKDNEKLIATEQALRETEQTLRETQQALRETEFKLNATLDSAADGIIVVNNKNEIISSSKRILKILGIDNYNGESIDSAEIVKIVYQRFDEPDQYLKKVEQINQTSETVRDHFRLKNGNTIEYYTQPLIIDEKKEGRVWSYRNVTEQLKVIQTNENFEHQLRGMYDASSHIATIITDNSKPPLIEEFSEGAETIWQYKKEEVIGKPITMLFTPDMTSRISLNKDEFFAKGKGFTAFPTARKKDGKIFPAMNTLYPLLDKNGKIYRIVGVCLDMTEKRSRENALIESESRSRNLIDSSPMGMHIYKVDEHGDLILIDANKAADEITGIDTKKLIGKKQQEAFPALIGTELPERYTRAALLGETWSNTDLYYEDDQIQGAFDIQAFQIAPRQMAVMFREVTETMKTEEKLRISEEKYRQIFHNIQDVYFELDNDRCIVELSPSVSKISKYTREELIGKKLDILSSDDKFMFSFLQRITDEGELTNLDVPIKDKDGSVIICSVNVRLEMNEDGTSTRMIGSLRDVTDQKKDRQEIVKLSRAVEQSPSTVVITDTNGTIEYVNRKFCELTGYSIEEAVGQKTNILKSGYHSESDYKQLWETITSGNEWRGEFLNKRKDGSTFWEMASISAIRNSIGEITHFLGIKEDITERKQVEKQLMEAKEKAVESDRLKSAFLANMSHEIRTPMNAILGFSELLQSEDLSEEDMSQYIQLINTKGKELMALISDLIDISRIEAGDMSLHLAPVDINHFLEKTVYTFKEEKLVSSKSEVSIRYNFPEVISPVCHTDKNRFSQIIHNLLSNAIKFTEHGYIELGYIMKESQICFYVKDTGIGIPEEKISIIFERFRQADDSISRKYGGTGLGLSICKHITELLGGDIWVESEPGQGSTFYFTLPIVVSGTKPVNDHTRKKLNNKGVPVRLQNKKILIAEDDSSNYLYLESLLRKSEAELVWAKNGQQAVDFYHKNKDSDLIIMDIRMPVKDGLQATREIRKVDTSIPIIALTAFAFADDKEKTLNAGCDEYLSKPVRPQQLRDLLVRFLVQ